jgi:hypothetical protein
LIELRDVSRDRDEVSLREVELLESLSRDVADPSDLRGGVIDEAGVLAGIATDRTIRITDDHRAPFGEVFGVVDDSTIGAGHPGHQSASWPRTASR